MTFKNIIKLLRPNQWYKNLVIFLAIIFSKNLFNLAYLEITMKGFLVLILASSANYIFNDLMDINKDKLNPEKRKRPLASGTINKTTAIILLFIFLGISLIWAHALDILFFYIILAIITISTAYSLFLKNLLFIDLITVSSNFVLRAIAGAVIINVFISPWLIIGTFFFSLFLLTGKRYGEKNYQKDLAYRPVLKHYSKKILFSLFNIFMTILILGFVLYSLLSEHKNLFWTIPLFIYLILRYYYLAYSNNYIARNPEKSIKDPFFLMSLIVFTVVSITLIMW